MINAEIRKALNSKNPTTEMENIGYRLFAQETTTYYYIEFDKETIISHDKRTKTTRRYEAIKEPGIEE
jgi:hypothetical protein